jgi:hypothetical protein
MEDEFDMELDDLLEVTTSTSIASCPRPFAVVRKRRPSRLAGVLGTLKAVKKQFLRNPYRQKPAKLPKV